MASPSPSSTMNPPAGSSPSTTTTTTTTTTSSSSTNTNYQHDPNFDTMTPPHLKEMFINSTDILYNHSSIMDQTIPYEWNDKPPLFSNLYPESRQKRGWFNRLSGANNTNKPYSPEIAYPNLLKGVSFLFCFI